MNLFYIFGKLFEDYCNILIYKDVFFGNLIDKDVFNKGINIYYLIIIKIYMGYILFIRKI